jgi:hypothetical protein
MGRILAQGHEQGCKRYLLKVKCLRYVTPEERARAFEELIALRAPVGTVEEMERESSSDPDEPLP